MSIVATHNTRPGTNSTVAKPSVSFILSPMLREVICYGHNCIISLIRQKSSLFIFLITVHLIFANMVVSSFDWFTAKAFRNASASLFNQIRRLPIKFPVIVIHYITVFAFGRLVIFYINLVATI